MLHVPFELQAGLKTRLYDCDYSAWVVPRA